MDLELYQLYNIQYINSICESIDSILFVIRKWNECDYVWPFSDMDYRYVLKADALVDFFSVNENIYQVHVTMQHRDSCFQRILEHPPGYIFFADEIEKVYFEDYRIWSFAGGDEAAFCHFKTYWDDRDDFCPQYYYKILAKRFDRFSLDAEFTNYDSHQLVKYNLYCALWHYAFPCLFALHSLHRQRSMGCKVHSVWLEDALVKVCYDYVTTGEIVKKTPHVEDIVECATDLIKKTAVNLNVEIDNIGCSLTKRLPFYEAVAMLRVRMARMILYLDEDEVNRAYLIQREILELSSIFDSIALYNGTDIDRFACNLLHQNQSATEKMRSLREHMLKYKKYYNYLMNLHFR